MTPEELSLEISERDKKISEIDSALPLTLESIIDGKTIRIDSGLLFKVEFVEEDPDSWEDTRRGELVVSLDAEDFFMIDVSFDSWGKYTWFQKGPIKKVRQVPVQRMVWEEV